MRDRSGRLMNLRDSKRVAEIERNMSRWDEVQLMRSGVVERVGHDDDDDDRERVMLVVKDAKPPFLDGRQIFTKQMEPVVPLKDATSDLAVVARKGSKLVMQVCALCSCLRAPLNSRFVFWRAGQTRSMTLPARKGHVESSTGGASVLCLLGQFVKLYAL